MKRTLWTLSTSLGLLCVPLAHSFAFRDLHPSAKNRNHPIEQRASVDALPTSSPDAHQYDKILPAAVVVGSITAGLGFLYGKVLDFALHSVWKTLPARLGATRLNPSIYIPAIMTSGALVLGILSAMMPPAFTVADFVTAFSKEPNLDVPGLQKTLLPLLLLSLITSTCGFSLGPEAPMVCSGALVGAALAKEWNLSVPALAYAGAAGSLTSFMGIPIAGSIFALEMTRRTVAFPGQYIGPAVAASVAAIMWLRTILIPSALVGGRFSYAAGINVAPTGRELFLVAGATGVIGGTIGVAFQQVVSKVKSMLWTRKSTSKASVSVLVKGMIGLLVGLLSVRFPQTMFWGEGSLQSMIDGQKTAFSATHHGLSSLLTSKALVNPSLPFASTNAVNLALAKLVAITLASSAKFPGGIIFPLFAAVAPLGQLVGSNSLIPIAVVSLMASTQASVTRTPLATTLILALSASSNVSILFPATLVAAYIGVWTSQLLSKESYFSYRE